MKPIVSVSEMQAADASALQHTSHEVLVARAGRAVANGALSVLGGAYGRRIVAICGPGSNGADGRVAARLLADRGARVEIIEAKAAPASIGAVDLVIDGAYGTGLRGGYRPPTLAPGQRVVAIDIPSGLDADSGAVDEGALAAEVTVTMAGLKSGLLQGHGRQLAGVVKVADIGIALHGAQAWLVETEDLADISARAADAHKWTTAVGVVAGSPGMTGAAALCARGAQRAGAGMIRLVTPQAALLGGASPYPLECVAISAPGNEWSAAALEATARCRSVVIGPGLGRDESTVAEIRRFVAHCALPLVIDADALVALGSSAAKTIAARPAATICTPHGGEYQALAGVAPSEDRLSSARSLAQALGAVVLLKGSTTVVARPDALAYMATAGSARLASAGTGDVLAGIIGALVARGVDIDRAGALAAHVHGVAASQADYRELVAGDLPELVAGVLDEAGGGVVSG